MSYYDKRAEIINLFKAAKLTNNLAELDEKKYGKQNVETKDALMKCIQNVDNSDWLFNVIDKLVRECL